ncbi:MAG: hypothetical protein IKG72_13030 [Bacillus sp. (in: Bacteria)]|nr:hypothetical protein [Parasporobacterium sp.]MBR3381006.1 hypothetical protein [Bacillus sp. (in: firmicutes)]
MKKAATLSKSSCEITIDPSFPQEYKAYIQVGVAIANKHWPVTQKLTFIPSSGRTRNGWCRKISAGRYRFLIGINTSMINPNDVIQTVIHEVLHSYKETYREGHKGEWKKRAAAISAEYPDLHIRRTNHCEKDVKTLRPFKHFIKCEDCGHVYEYVKMPTKKVIAEIKKGERYCGCCKSHRLIFGNH